MRMTLRICIAPGDFGDGLTAAEASIAMERGAARLRESTGIKVSVGPCPISDRGVDTLDALALADSFSEEEAQVEGLGGGEMLAEWGQLKPRRSKLITATTVLIHTALIIWMTLLYAAYMLLIGRRSATSIVDTTVVVGVDLLQGSAQDPTALSTFGAGELLCEALDEGNKRVLVTTGPTATCDGGVGLASALGVRFFDHDDHPIERPTGADLRRIARVDPSGVNPDAKGADLVVACDTDLPLTGSVGMARMIGPERGATPTQVEDLDLGLESLVARCREAGLEPDPDAPGAGAGGGIAFALATFCDARLAPASETILETVRFERRLERSDVVLTGPPAPDGLLSPWSASAAIAPLADELGVPMLEIDSGDGSLPLDDRLLRLEEATEAALESWLLA